MTSRVLLLAVIFPAWSLAQFSSGALSGEIRDESGVAVTAAPVVARQVATGFSRTAQSNSAGQYALPNLPPGEYSITVVKAGFRSVTVDHVVIEVDHPITLGFDLKA